MQTTTFSVRHLVESSNHDFPTTIHRFEEQLGTYDPGVLDILAQDPEKHAEEVESKIRAMEGSSGFMRFGPVLPHGLLLSLAGKPISKASQYVIGNPLFAVKMTQHNLGAALYAPLRVLIWEDRNGVTRLEYDLPSSLFGQFDDENVKKVGVMLDQKMEKLVNKTITS